MRQARSTTTFDLDPHNDYGLQRALQTFDSTRTTAQAARRDPSAFLRSVRAHARLWLLSVVSTISAIILVWLVALYLGEITAFSSSVRACDWGEWERWVRWMIHHRIELQY